MNERNLDFSTLSERISAQTQAYVDFSNALVKIIEQTAAIRDRLNDTNDHLKDDSKHGLEKIQELLTNIAKVSSDTTTQHSLFAKDSDLIKAQIHEFELKITDLIKQNETQDADLKLMLSDIIKYSKRNLDQMSALNEQNIAEFLKLQKEQIKHFDEFESKISLHNGNVSTFMTNIKDKIDSYEKKFSKIAVYIFAIIGIITIVSTLMQLRIIDVKWFVK